VKVMMNEAIRTWSERTRKFIYRFERLLRTRHFWIVAAMLAVSTFFHYFTPQIRFLPLASFHLSRHTIERIIFILPVAGAAFAFGQTGGSITLIVAVLIMLPRVFLLSPYPIDSLVETIGIAVVGYLMVWMIETQEKEKKLRQKAVEELKTVNAIAFTVSQSLDLDEILDKALGMTLEVARGLEARGGIFLLDVDGRRLRLRAHHGLSPRFIQREVEIAVGECLCGLVAETGEVLIVSDALGDPRHTRCPELEPHSHICVPLKFRDRVLGVMDLYLQGTHQPDATDKQLFASVGRQIGVAVENARLYENMRFYVRQITKAQEDERKRIARELHDDTAQALIDLSRRLDGLATSGEQLSESTTKRLEEFQELIGSILQSVRRFSRDLRPSVLDDLGLLPALEWLMADLRESGIEPELKVYGDRRRLLPEVELVLFRIVQEALNNVRKHSQASRVVITVEFGEGRARITVDDDGRGFELPGRTGDLAAMGKLGLVGMHERVQLLGGTLTVQSGLGEGTRVMVDVPA
jgi:two-component system sensor histidine kinase DegS